jgi:hypothetical protein
MASPISLSPTLSLRLKLLEPPATANPRFTAFYADTSPEGVDTIQGQLDGATPVIAVPAPSAGRRIVSNLVVQNQDTAAFALVLETFDGTNAAEVFQVFLQPGDYLSGGSVYDQYGSLKSGTTGPQGIQGIKGNSGADGADGLDGANGADGVDGITPGLAYSWSTATTSPPGAGELKANNATYPSITQLYVHESDRNSTDVSAVLGQIASGTLVQIQSGTDTTKYAWFTVTSITDNGGDRAIAVIYLTSAGAFVDGENVSLAFFRKGMDGIDGIDGAGSVSSVNAVGPDGSGNVSLNPASIGAEPSIPNGTASGQVLTWNGSAKVWAAPSGGSGGGSAPSDPLSIFGSNLKCFLSGDSNGNGTFSGDYFTQWNDLSSNSNNAAQSNSSSRPFSTYWRNGNIVVPYFSIGRYFTLPNFLSSFPSKGFLWFVINNRSHDSLCYAGTGLSSDPYDVNIVGLDGLIYGSHLRSARLEGVSGVVPSLGVYVVFIYSTTNLYRIYVNGRIAYETTDQSWGVTTAPELGRSGSYGKRWIGEIATFGACDDVPSNAQINNLMSWIKYLWLQ